VPSFLLRQEMCDDAFSSLRAPEGAVRVCRNGLHW
jgi:hypothetical protein